ncbi:MAG: hypothetical protein JSR61_12190 [Proteobacteria bacterium]|nr:hypothetical protein [Pseudomonadota bacterium]
MNRLRTFPPFSLGDIVGHAGAVSRIRRRFIDDGHQTALLLYGPEGVGKGTLARAYVRALLCDDRRQDRSLPCGECDICIGMKNESGNIDFLELDARVSSDAAYVREVLKAASIGPRRVVLTKNFDIASPAFVDALLKPLEDDNESESARTEQRHNPVMIFLARDLRGVRQAGQSRCQIERLKPLDTGQRAELCDRIFEARGISFNDEVARDTFLVGCRGLPGVLVAAADQLGDERPITALDARRALGLEWTDAAIEYLSALFDENGSLPAVLFGEVETGEATTRMRVIWSYLTPLLETDRPHRNREVATALIDSARIEHLADLLMAKARATSIQPRELWSAVAERLLAEDYADQAGFTGLVTAFKRSSF